MKKILIGASLFVFSGAVLADDNMLEQFKGETSESIHNEFFMGKGFAKVESDDRMMMRYNDSQNSFTFVFKDNKVVDAYKVKK